MPFRRRRDVALHYKASQGCGARASVRPPVRTLRGRSANCPESRCARGGVCGLRGCVGEAQLGSWCWFVRAGSSGRFCRSNRLEEPSRLGVSPGRLHRLSEKPAKNRTELQNRVKIRPDFLRNLPELYPCCIPTIAIAQTGGRRGANTSSSTHRVIRRRSRRGAGRLLGRPSGCGPSSRPSDEFLPRVRMRNM